MQAMLLNALVKAIVIKNRSLSFYGALCSKVTHKRVKKLFERLVQEEKQLLDSVCNLYPGNNHDLVEILFKNNLYEDPQYSLLLDTVRGCDKEKCALELSLNEERACIDWFSTFAETVRDQPIHDDVLRVLGATINHCEMIKGEYLRHSNMAE